jgi:predicted MFS family arabinose efflux permease
LPTTKFGEEAINMRQATQTAASAAQGGSDNVHTTGLLGKVRFPKGVAASLLGVTLFLIGDGLESVWITDFAHTELGYELGVSALLLTFYGVVVAVGSFLSMALADAIGPRRIMMAGLASFAVFDTLFITVGIPSGDFALLVAVYSCRGLGYPFFAMGFFAWLMKKSKPAEHGPVSGWFFFFYSLGLQILGSYAASFLLPRVGEIGALWAGLALAVAGGGIGLGFMRGPGVVLTAAQRRPMGLAVVRSLSIICRVPKIAVCSVIGAINLIGPLALSAFYVTYLTDEIGLGESGAVLVFTIVGIFAVVGNVVWGNIGNALGWTNVVRFGAGPLCAAAVLFFYYAPKLVGPNFAVIALGGVLLGFGVSAFIPLNALFLAHSRGETGSALAASGLARGLASFLGPALTAAILSAGGYTGVVWTVAGLYLSILVLGRFIRLPGNAKIAESPADAVAEAPAEAPAESPAAPVGAGSSVDAVAEPPAGLVGAGSPAEAVAEPPAAGSPAALALSEAPAVPMVAGSPVVSAPAGSPAPPPAVAEVPRRRPSPGRLRRRPSPSPRPSRPRPHRAPRANRNPSPSAHI